jgi:serine/threonine protein kinase
MTGKDLSGNKILEYTIEKKISYGSFSTCYLIKDVNGTCYACKVASNLRDMKYLKRESAILKWCNEHNAPNLVKSLDYIKFTCDCFTHLVMIMPLYETDLRAHVVTNGYLDSDTAMFYFSQVIEAVKFLHDHSIVHADIKLANMLLKDNHVYLCDMGMSYLEKSISDALTSCTNEWTPRGTPNYSSPEIMNNTETIGKHIDIWALGVSLLCMQQEPPFRCKTLKETKKKIRSMDYYLSDSLSPRVIAITRAVFVPWEKRPNILMLENMTKAN